MRSAVRTLLLVWAHLAVVASGVVSLVNGSESPPAQQFKVPLRRPLRQRALSDGVVVGEDSMYPGNVRFISNEIQRARLKYSPAPDFLRGVGLNPDTHPELGYVPFHDTTIGSSSNHTGPGLSASSLSPNLTTSGGEASLSNATNNATNARIPSTMHLTDHVVDNFDLLYYGPISLGTPAQPLTVSIDTGSADLWVATDCHWCDNAQFAPKQSSTYRKTSSRFSIAYGQGHARGVLAQDVVSVGRLRVDNQWFGAVSTMSDDLNAEPNSGLIGLAFGTIAASKKPTFFENLLTSRQLDLAIFSVHLTRHQADGSEVCFGCFDPAKATGGLRWVSLASKTYWLIPMDGVSAGHSGAIRTNLLAAVDTGASLIHLPDRVASEFYGLIPGARNAGPGFYTFPCATSLQVSFSFAGESFSVHSDDLNIGTVGETSDDCLGGIVGLDEDAPSNLAILGDAFLKSWYTTFDYAGKRVGFAPSINNIPIQPAQ